MAITRFAPSPTGYLHIGGLRTALYSYLWAKKTNGEFKLRIEDTDNARNNEDAVKAILEAFEWVGMPSDCEIEYQSKRTDIYKKYITQLLEEGKAYKCYMSRDELDALRAKQEAAKENPRYDGTWRPEDGKVLQKYKLRITNNQLKNEIKLLEGTKIDRYYSNSFNIIQIPASKACNGMRIQLTNEEKVVYPNLTDVIREIILSQIEIKNLDELISTVTKNIKKQYKL